MTVSYLDLLDLFRYVTAAFFALFMLCDHTLEKRSHYALRLVSIYVVWCLGAFTLILSRYYEASYPTQATFLRVFFSVHAFCMVIIMIKACYKTTWSSVFFRATVASCIDGILTTVIRYFIVLICFPSLPEEHTILYILLMLVLYIVTYSLFYKKVGRVMLQEEREKYLTERRNLILFLILFGALQAFGAITRMVCEYTIVPLQEVEAFVPVFYQLRYYCVAILLFVYVGILAIIYYLYGTLINQNEMDILNKIITERKAQYDFSKENIEMINQKCHNLKHQIRALEMTSGEERRQLIRETQKAVVFYGAVVKTGNEALDTILTEKSMYCLNRNIKLSCSVNTDKLAQISVVDLYTLLGNAIDNAIESVEKIQEVDKRIINLSIKNQGEMLHITLENYYEGNIIMKGKYPFTSKSNKENHGYGIKSIWLIAQKYGGEIQIHTENQVFLLQILLPI